MSFFFDDPFLQLMQMSNDLDNLNKAVFGQQSQQGDSSSSSSKDSPKKLTCCDDGKCSSLMAMGKDAWCPCVDVKETDRAYQVHAELPGVEKKDISIQLQGNEHRKCLIIQGKKEHVQSKDTDKYHRSERSFGSFYRTFCVPPETQERDITAKFNNGVLEVLVPKHDHAAEEVKKITIQ